jgi:RNA-directed DNA polymerase
VGGLFDRIVDAGTLAEATWRAALGKRHRPEVRRFLADIDQQTGTLARMLRDGTFRFGEYRVFTIRDPKTRAIHAPPFCDRVVHHAIVAAAGPVFERGAIACSYACRAGRGQHAALGRVRDWTRAGSWFLKADVAKFYDSIDHGVLMMLLERRFRERRLLNLFEKLLDSYSHLPGKGLPIGALTSQYLGNFYLDPVDHWVTQTRGLSRYLRYMDDLLVFGGREELDALRQALPPVFEGIGLKAKNGGILNRCDLGVPYLGFVIYPGRVRLNQQGRRRLRRRVKVIESDFLCGRMAESELQSRGEALFAHARFGSDIAWRRMVMGFSLLRETLEPEPRPARRFLEQ